MRRFTRRLNRRSIRIGRRRRESMRMRRVQPRPLFVLPKDRRDRGERERKDDARQKNFLRVVVSSRLPLLPSFHNMLELLYLSFSKKGVLKVV